jgi:hypothetical protein
MKLFLANTTKQHHQFYYRPPDWLQPKTVDIPAGTQMQIGGDMSSDQISFILKQHAPYGLTAAKDLQRTAGYIGLVYSVDTPVKLEEFLSTFERNDHEINANAVEKRETAAAAIADGTSAALGIPVQRVEVELVEESAKGGVTTIAEGHEVVAEGVAPRHPGRKGRRQVRSEH